MRSAGTTAAPRKPLTVLRSRLTALTPAERVEVGLREAQVPHRPDEPAALDEEGAVAGHAGDDRELRVDDVRVVESGHEQPAIEAADELVARRRAGGHHRVQRERAPRVRRRQAVAGRLVRRRAPRSASRRRRRGRRRPRRAARAASARPRSRRPCGRPFGSAPSSTIVTRSLPIRRPGSANERPSWTARAEKPEVAELVGDVDDRVLLEDDRVVAGGRRVTASIAGAGLRGRLAPDRRARRSSSRPCSRPRRSRCRRRATCGR